MGNHFSNLYGEICTELHFIPDVRDPHVQDYLTKNCAYTGLFVFLLLLISWWNGQSGFEKRLDPVEASYKERSIAIQKRDDAERALEEMGTKYERAMGSNLELRAELNKASKDLPWLEQRHLELAEENITQHNEIERLGFVEQKYNELLQQVCDYGMSAKRPEFYQQKCEELQRKFEISNNLLEKAQKQVRVLIEEKSETQGGNLDEEKEWLKAQLKKNSRSPAYWAKHRTNTTLPASKPAWGVRCRCTEPEIAYDLKDQRPRIVELEATVAARDLTITNLRKSRLAAIFRNNGNTSTSDAAKPSLPSTEQVESNTIAGSQIATTTPVHACEHEQQRKDLEKQVTDDAKTIADLRKECQDLKNAASDATTVDAAGINARTELLGELATKDTMIKRFEEEKIATSRELEARDEMISDLRKEKVTASEELATSNQAVKELREEKVTTGEELAAKEKEVTVLRGQQTTTVEELAAKNKEVDDLRAEKTTTVEELAAKNKEVDDLRAEKTVMDNNAGSAISKVRQDLSDCMKELATAREELTECTLELGQRKSRITELETTQCRLEVTIKQKDTEIDDLERANQEIINRPAPESAENFERLRTANANLDDLRNENAGYKGQLETQTAKISELEAAAREMGPSLKVKDDRISSLEEQLHNSPSNDLIERQKEVIIKKDQDYGALYNLYNKMLDQHKLTENKHKEEIQSMNNTIQQRENSKQQELQRLWTERNDIRTLYTNREGRISDLENQLRQGGNVHTDLQTEYSTLAQELDAANQKIGELQGQAATLRQENASLAHMNSSDDTFEKYRVEGENRARPIWQANVDRELTARALKLEASEGQVFKLQNQLQQAKTQANPLREMQLKAREDAVKAKEDALKHDANAMDHDSQQQGSKAEQDEITLLEGKLTAANKEAGDARARNRGIQNQLNKEKKERAEEKARHERELKKEKDDFERRSSILKVQLEKERSLKKPAAPS